MPTLQKQKARLSFLNRALMPLLNPACAALSCGGGN